MSARGGVDQAAGARPVVVTPSRTSVAIALLSWREARRILTRPVYLLLVAGLLTGGVSSAEARSGALVQRTIVILLTYGALATLFAVSLVATSARRTGAEAQLAATPLDSQLRTLATGLGVLLGPVGLASLLTLVLFFVERSTGAKLEGTFSGWEYIALPLTWMGAGLLGLALARWLPWPGMPLAALVGLIAWTVWGVHLLDAGNSAGFLMPYVISAQELGMGTTSAIGHLGWHAVYLLGLCLLALGAALLSHRPLRQRTVVGFIVLSAVLTASAGWLQVP